MDLLRIKSYPTARKFIEDFEADKKVIERFRRDAAIVLSGGFGDACLNIDAYGDVDKMSTQWFTDDKSIIVFANGKVDVADR